jgi:hypothetical protein
VDVLHEGPVPAGLSLEQLTETRARFIAASGWERYEVVLEGFQQRNAVLRRCRDADEVVLWFEHDLYDQLQLIQILSWFAAKDLAGTRLSLICIDAFPGVEPFLGLGQLQPTQLASLFGTRQPVRADQLTLAAAAWNAYRAPDPQALERLLAGETSALPFVGRALRRHLEQYPAVENGLGRTERQLLAAIAAGARTTSAIFREEQAMDESPFMGDLTIWAYLRRLSDASAPAIQLAEGGTFFLPQRKPDMSRDGPFAQQQLVLTARGRALLDNSADWIHLNGLDRWLGGVHLQSPGAVWRWDAQRGALVRG